VAERTGNDRNKLLVLGLVRRSRVVIRIVADRVVKAQEMFRNFPRPKVDDSGASNESDSCISLLIPEVIQYILTKGATGKVSAVEMLRICAQRANLVHEVVRVNKKGIDFNRK
jgi:hypothetical protein